MATHELRVGSRQAGKLSIPSSVKRVTTYSLVAVITILWGAPLLWMIVSSMKPPNEMYVFPPDWIPDQPTLENYIGVFDRFPILLWFKNSFLVATITTIITLIVDILAAYPLARMRFPGRNLLLLVILSTFLLPPEILFVPLFLGLSSLGISDSYFSLAVPAAGNAFGVFLLTQFFRTLPAELEDAAIIDGCSRWGVLLRIIVPLSMPAIAAVSIFSFLGSWNNFFWPVIVTNSDATRTLPVGLSQLVAGAGLSSRIGITMVAAAVATIPVLILFVLLQRYFVQGIATTGLKS